MTQRIRIESEVRQATDWLAFRNLLVDVLVASGFATAPSAIQSAFDADVFGDPRQMVDLVVGAAVITDANALQRLYSAASMQAAATPTFLQLLLTEIDGLSATPAARVAGNNKVVHIGDSRSLFAAGPVGALNSRYPLTMLRQRMRGRLHSDWNYSFGTGGFTLAQVQSTHYPQAVATDAKTLVILAGVNDLGSNPTASAATMIAMATAWAARGPDYVAVMCDDVPPDTWAGNMTGHVAMRDLIRAAENPAAGIRVWRTWAAITGGADGTTAIAGQYTDGLHFNTAGAGTLASPDAIALFNEILPAFDLLATPAALAATLAIGTLAASDLATNRTGSVGTYTASMVTFEGDTWVQLVAAGADGNGGIYRNSSTVPGDFVAGTTVVQSVCEYVLLDGHANVRNFNLGAYKQSGSDLKANVPSGAAGFDGQHSGSGSDATVGSFPAGEHRGFLWTPPCLFAADATQFKPWWVQLQARTAGSMNATLLLRNFQCRKLA